MNPSLDDSYAFCSRVARKEARNFYPSFLLLPADRRRSMCALYAFLRRSDDLADEPRDLERKRELLQDWRGQLGRVDRVGQPLAAAETTSWEGWPALFDTLERHRIPTRYLFEVLDGVEMDLVPQPFETFDELHHYCYRVASAVGFCCLHIWGFRSEDGRAEALADATGLALQLTNIIRDVREDALNDRIYLPTEDMERFSVDPESLRGTKVSAPLRKLLAFEVERAYAYYEEAKGLEALVDPVGRPVLRALVGVYRRLLDEIVRKDYEVLGARVSVPKWRKLAILMQAYGSRYQKTHDADVLSKNSERP